jgi:Protein of unknown function (DUF3631)
MTSIFNSGYERASANIMRSARGSDGSDYDAKHFAVSAPVVFGFVQKSGAPLLPETVQSRSLDIILKRKRKDEKVRKLAVSDEADLKALKERAQKWTKLALAQLQEADPELPDCLYNRDQDNWRPLIAVADAAGGHWPQTAREVAREISGHSEDPDIRVKLLAVIRRPFEAKGLDRIETKTLIGGLCGDEERPWQSHNVQDTAKSGYINDNSSKYSYGISDRQIAALLRDFGIKPKMMRFPGAEKPMRGYERAPFEDAWSRYL